MMTGIVSSFRHLLALLTLGALLLVSPPSVSGQPVVLGCGDLVLGLDSCVLFQPDAGGLFFLENLGGFVPGDRVQVFGVVDPGCFNTCLVPCVTGNTIEACLEAPPRRITWRDVIGIVQPGNIVGSGSGQVVGDAQPWSTVNGDVWVNLKEAKVAFKVRGLVAAGGNFVGTPRPITQVVGTVVCNVRAPGDSVLIDTPPVPLSEQGDADFRGDVPLPAACSAEPNDIAFLIRTPAGVWIANGAVRRLHP